MIQMLIPAVTELASGWLKGKADEKAAVARTKVAKAEAEAEVMKVAATHEAGWEKIMAQGSQDSWKDEWAMYASIGASFGLRGLNKLKR